MGSLSSLFSVISRTLPLSFTNRATALYFKASALRDVGIRGFHSEQKLVSVSSMRIRILPALSDNYMYLLVDEDTKQAAIVDPVDPDSVIKAVAEEEVVLTTVLTTHHHWDHAGGNKELISKVSGLNVIGGDSRIDGVTRMVKHGDELQVGGLNVTCFFTPCHTTGHICYYVTRDQDKVVFTGDTLFLGGCGRFFEGTAEQMHEALVNILGKLPPETKVFCGHEYSLQNLGFAAHVEPDNQYTKDKISWCREQRSLTPAQPTVPSTIAEELLINPFMRVNKAPVQTHTGQNDAVEAMRALRAEKDNFKPKK